MTYAAALSFSWALTWRLVVAQLVLLLILLTLLIAFGSPRRGVNAPLFDAMTVLLAWLLAWPFVIKRVLAPEVVLANSPHDRFRVRYSVAVILGIVSDLGSLVPVAGLILVLRLFGVTSVGAFALIVFLLFRMLLVLPLCVRAVSQRVPRIA